MNTKLKNNILNDRCLLQYLPIRTVYNIINDYDYSLCYEALVEKGSPDLYEKMSDWFGIFIYDSTGKKHLVGLMCTNDNYHIEFKKDDKIPLHLSEIEIEPKFRGENFMSENKLHAFSNGMKTWEKGAKDAGYSLLTLQAINKDKIPIYEHMGFHKIDYKEYSDKINNIEYEKFYNIDHPYMIKEI